MGNQHVRTFDLYLLKPLWLLLLTAAVILLLNAVWWAGAGLIALAVFGVGGIGASIRRKGDLIQSIAAAHPEGIDSDRAKTLIDYGTSQLLGPAILKLTAILAFAATIIALNFGFRWYLALLVGCAGLGGGYFAVSLVLAIVYKVRGMRPPGYQRSNT